MSDIADKADKEIETNLALFLALQQRSGKVTRPEDWDGFCTDCGDEVMPRERLKLGYVTCITCQEFKERGR